ncbi:hypothetical protein NC652_032728 [Populus alba x Populus x berolinensis]|nr:hypothetical protein NC652_032728 [Populus alba x Populus x berolinensis]
MGILFTIFTVTAAGLLFILISFLYLTFQIYSGKSIKNPNYPPVKGTVFGQLFYFNRLYDHQTEVAKKQKTFRLLAPGQIGFGVELNCLEGSNKEGTEFMKAFDDSNALVYRRYVDPLWKLKRYFNICSEASLKKNIKIIDDFVTNLIGTKRKLQAEERLYDGRCAEVDDVLPDGFRMKKGDGLYYMAYAMGRMPYIWGDDAGEFRPERWLNNGIFQPESPFKFIAFHEKHKYHPVGGTVFNQLLHFNRLHDYMTDLAGKYKTYRLIAPFRSEVYTADPVNVEYILKTNFENYGKGDLNYNNLSGLLGDGIFTVDGDKWRQQRKVSSYEFSTKVLRDFSSVVFRKNVAKLANIVSEAAKANQSMDIQDLFMKSTLDSIFKVAFGVELDSMCGSNEEGVKFTSAFDDASALTLWRYVDVFWKIKRFLNIGSEAALKKNVKVVNDFVYKLINKKIELMRNSEEVSSLKKDDILSRFLQVTENDPTYLRDIILNFVIAGKDTTAAALSWLIYMLCKHPAVQNKIAQEVKEATKVKEITDFAEFAASINEEALEKMKYLHAAITETLRLYPSVPVDAKVCFSDDTLPDGFNVRKGDMVAYQPYAMGRMKFIWGDDAEEYKPERWFNEDGVFQQESPFKFTAFQAGPRICLGKEFAYRQMKIFAAVLVTSFTFKLADERKPKSSITPKLSRIHKNERCAEVDDILPDGFRMKKGDGLYYLAYAKGRMPYIWGDDAGDFRPERWLNNGIFQPASPFKFIAFHYHPVGGTVFNHLLNFNGLHHYMTDLAGKCKTHRLLTPFRISSTTTHSVPATRVLNMIKQVNIHLTGTPILRYCTPSPSVEPTASSPSTPNIIIAMLKQRRVVKTNRYFPSNQPNILFSSNMASIDALSNPLKFSALVLILSIFIVQLFIRKLNKKQKKYKYHPVAGTVFTQLLHFNRVHHYMTNLAGKYKTYRLRAPFRSEIYTVDPVNVEYILKTNFENYGKGDHNYDNLSGLLGDGIFTVDGHKWRQQRKVSSYEFSTKVLRDFSSVIFRKNVAKLANIVSDAAKANQSMDIQDLFMKSTLDSIFKVGFGVELDSMCGSNEEGVKFTSAFDDASALTLWRYVDVFWKIKRFLNIGSEAALKKNVKVLKKDDILSRFLQVTENDPTYLRDIILNFVIAGKDTTATALSWFIYMLCKNPAVQNTIAQEVREATKVKEITDYAEFAASINEEALEKMHYLHAAISETLRLYPSVPVDGKICFSDDTLPDGFNVRKGDMVAYQPYAMGRMKFIWGDDAEEYKPERWLKDGVFQQESPFKFTAFQAGPRICLGKEFAYRQMKIFAAVLVTSFTFKLADEKKPVNYRTMINLHVDGGLHVFALHRNTT